MIARPVNFATACDAVGGWHRHHIPPQGHVGSFGCYDNGVLRGVVMIGRPVNPRLQAQGWLEVIRLATDGSRNVCSFLYGVAVRWLRGFNRIVTRAGGEPFTGLITYILGAETGISLRAAGWTEDVLRADSSARRGRTWSRGSGHQGGGVKGARRRFSITIINTTSISQEQT